MKESKVIVESTTPDGASLRLLTHDGDYYLKVNGDSLMSTKATASEELMAELACGTLPSKKKEPRILIGGLGFGYTLRAVLKHAPEGAVVHVAELLPQVVEWNRDHLPEITGDCLDDPRVEIIIDDVAEIIKRSAGNRYDVIILDVDNGPDAFTTSGNSNLYKKRGLSMIKGAMTTKGYVYFWSAYNDKPFAKFLETEGFQVNIIPAKAYPAARKFSHTIFAARRNPRARQNAGE